MQKYLFTVFISILLLLSSCNSSTDNTPQPYSSGVIVVNAGNFTDNNGSISFINRSTNVVTFNTFNKENNRDLGGALQYYTEIAGKGYALVDNSTGQDKIEVIDSATMKSLGTIQDADLVNPRYLIPFGTDKAYLSYWGSLNADYSFKQGFVALIDLTTLKILKKIPVGKGPEQMEIAGNELFVTNQGDDTKLTIINTETNLSQNLTMGYNPKAIATDANGKLWILANNMMYRINPQTKAIEKSLKVGTHPEKEASNLTLSADKKTFYFTYSFYDGADNYKLKGETYSFGIEDSSIPANKPLINKVLTGLGFDPNQQLIYAGFTPSYKQAGYVYRYKPTGTLVDSIKVEIAPSGFYFR